MSMLGQWSKWRATPLVMWLMLLEAGWELLLARLTVAFRLKQSLPTLLKPQASSDRVPPRPLQRDVRYVIALATRHIFWRSLCLPSAIAAKRMLRRRGYGSTLRLGVGHTAAGDPHAHAWLETGGNVITGEEAIDTVARLPLPGTPKEVEQV